MNLEDRLREKEKDIISALEQEKYYVDRKDGIPEMNLRYALGKVQGALVGIEYMRMQIKYEWIKED